MPFSTQINGTEGYMLNLSVEYVIELLEKHTNKIYCGWKPPQVAKNKEHPLYIYINGVEHAYDGFDERSFEDWFEEYWEFGFCGAGGYFEEIQHLFRERNENDPKPAEKHFATLEDIKRITEGAINALKNDRLREFAEAL